MRATRTAAGLGEQELVGQASVMACKTMGSYGEESASVVLSELNQLMLTFELPCKGKLSSSFNRQRPECCETHRTVEHISPERCCNRLVRQSFEDTVDHGLTIVRRAETDVTLAGDLEHSRHRFSLSRSAQPYPDTIVILIEEVH